MTGRNEKLNCIVIFIAMSACEKQIYGHPEKFLKWEIAMLIWGGEMAAGSETS